MSSFALAQLGEIAELQAGVGFPVDLQGRSSGDYPVAKVGDISRVGRSSEAVISAADHYIDEGDLARLRARPIPPGSVLFAKIGEAIRQNHRVIAGCALLVDNNAMAAIPTRRVESRYLYHYLRTVDFYGLASATTVPALRKSELERLPVPLPPLPEQRRITEILDKADALRAKRREALAELDTLTQSIFLDMFGDPATNPKGWPVLRMEEVAEIVSGATPRTGIREFWDGDVDWVTPKELSALSGIYIRGTERRITQAGLRSCAATMLPKGAVLFSSRAPIGHTAICGAPMATNQGFKSFIPTEDQLDAYFLLQWLRLRRLYLEALGSGATFKELSKAVVARIPIAVPPLEYQMIFAERLRANESLRLECQAFANALETLLASLQQRAFRGEL